MIEAWRALAERVVAEYRAALGNDVVAVACYGSVACGQAGPDSDLDFYVVTRRPVSMLLGRRLDRLDRLPDMPEYQALARQGYHTDPMPIFHAIETLRTHPWILLDIADHGVILFDPEGVLARELETVRRRLRELGSWAAHLARPGVRDGGLEREAVGGGEQVVVPRAGARARPRRRVKPAGVPA